MKSTDFSIGEIVWDSGNNCYGVVLNNYPEENHLGEVRLDSDGNQPLINLFKLGSDGDNGTKEALVECLKQHKKLVDLYNYKPVNY